ncbi:MAG TPA: FGGY-family carbohydrate kinase [Acidimicrobiales bacterium]|nr:FGGY-family carbohydrate kinase [Acidimicrobiales bacterium]
MSVLAVDVGTSGVRAAIVRPDSSVEHAHFRQVLPSSPAPGFVEFDAAAMADAVLEVSLAALAGGGKVDAVGITNQRASTIVWDRVTGDAVGPGIGWQDLRTAGFCLMLQAQGIRLAPNQSATKLAVLLDIADPDRSRDLCVGTVDTWVAWTLSRGEVHVSDLTNLAVTGLLDGQASGWDEAVLEALRIPQGALPRPVDSIGVVGLAKALPGAPPIAGLAGDQQASLVGQGCVRPGLAKATFGTGGMLDLCVGGDRPAFPLRGPGGTFPIVAWSAAGTITWGIEAIMLSAGSCIEWLRDDLGILSSAAESDELAASCADSGGVWFVPALLGLGTPVWDYGARGTLLGLTRGSGRAEVVRAVLEGIAHRGADLLEAAETDSGLSIGTLRVDGGMSANRTFTQALANTIARPVEISAVTEATTLGAAYLAGVAMGTWASLEEATAGLRPRAVIEPSRRVDRERWLEARDRSLRTVPELSDLAF